MIISIVIPTFNESENIKELFTKINTESKNKFDYEALIVDDGKDNTAQIAKELGARVIQGQHKGLGQAIIDGIKYSLNDIVVVMDADLSHNPKYIYDLIKALDKYDMAIGSRYVKGGGTEGWSLKRRIISRCACLLSLPITPIKDSTSGFFAVKKNSLKDVPLKADSWKIMLEIAVKAKLKFKEVPIVFKDRKNGESKFNKKQVIAYAKHLLNLLLFKYRILNFMIVGGIGSVVNIGIYYPLTLISKNEVTFLGNHFYLLSFVVSSLVAIFCNYYFNKLWTFNDRKAKKLSLLRYFGMALVTLILDMFLLFIFTDYTKIEPIFSAMLAIIVVFILRFIIADKLIWRK